jgi:hypothetical protein
MAPDEDLLTAEGCAEVLGVHVETIRRWARSGVLVPTVRKGRINRYSKLALLDAAAAPDELKQPPGPLDDDDMVALEAIVRELVEQALKEKNIVAP